MLKVASWVPGVLLGRDEQPLSEVVCALLKASCTAEFSDNIKPPILLTPLYSQNILYSKL